MQIRGPENQHFSDGHDHRCPDCPNQVLHLPSEICGSCGRCGDHHQAQCEQRAATTAARRRKDG